jgi:hypothetical protein
MRTLLLLPLAAALGCAPTPDDDSAQAAAALRATCGDTTLSAAKSYGPSTWYNAAVTLPRAGRFVLPAAISIMAGNAGNHRLELRYGVGALTVTCTYQGGSSQAHPIGARQIALGQRYLLRACTSGAVAGSTFDADRLSLRVDNGSSRFGTTRVAITLSDLNPCGAPASLRGDLAAGGNVSRSPRHTLVGTLGQSAGGGVAMRSSRHQLFVGTAATTQRP